MIDFIYGDTPQGLITKLNNLKKGYEVINIIQNKNGYIAFIKLDGRREQ